ncbi:TIGR03557 family F420-dependent LLM class oxidoreductase [Actinoalloteichus hoggarensis]|uniref:TIGR03557 family F420-dependent LLM class oxidoreductase n=1 Tax=Actinoalloteichus hoggarensis TaxID=1470176 RepID=UPI000B8B4B29|nr:TIGR03557 family F420-dependent LLM class oxidoreductase [Actinoalloteichus hoggarensis]
MSFGYTLFTEQAPPRQLVSDAVAAEAAGFDFAVSSDHYFPWLDSQGHASYCWSVLGAVAQATSRLELMTYVTCPIIRYHPAVVAQKAATVQLLSEGRFTLGVGAGENLNEHIVARGWPPVNVRHDMLEEALHIIGRLFDGGYVTHRGEHFHVDSAKVWDLPEQRVPIAVAVSGPQSIRRFATLSDHLVATEPKSELVRNWDEARSGTMVHSRKIGQQPMCFDADRDAAVARAHDQMRWFAGGWKVNSELPSTAAFAAASQFARPADVAEAIPCGDDVGAFVESVRPFAEAGFTDIALVQIGGGHQEPFFPFARDRLLPALRAEFG